MYHALRVALRLPARTALGQRPADESSSVLTRRTACCSVPPDVEPPVDPAPKSELKDGVM